MKEDQTKETQTLLETYQAMAGPIEFTLKSDIVFHYVMQESENALVGLVCSLKGLDRSQVKKVLLENPIDLNANLKETVMDIKLTLNNNETMNIELQMYSDAFWKPRSILYLCRAYDCIGNGDNYSLLKPTTHYCITDQEIGEADQFYSKYLLLNTETYQPYTQKLGINVLQLNHTDKATQEDIENKRVYWAELFKASTWEEFKRLADDDAMIEEVATLIFELNTDNQKKELLEGQRRYREQMATQYAAGYIDAENKYEKELADKDATIADKDATIADMQAELEQYRDKYGKL